MTDFRALCARMADELSYYAGDRRETHALATEARAALAQPADGEPSDKELLKLAAKAIEPYESHLSYAVTTWQPIDTAPKDGSEILVSDLNCIEIVHWQHEFATGDFHWLNSYGEIFFPHSWQPLPDHPKEAP